MIVKLEINIQEYVKKKEKNKTLHTHYAKHYYKICINTPIHTHKYTSYTQSVRVR